MFPQSSDHTLKIFTPISNHSSPKAIGAPPKVISLIVYEIDLTITTDTHLGSLRLASQILDIFGIRPRDQKDKRIDFCHNELLRDGIQWNEDDVLSDESKLCIHDDSRRLWMKHGIYTEQTLSA